MPYICVANSAIPDGSLQILDLSPNTSQALPALVGQTKYANRAVAGTLRDSTTTSVTYTTTTTQDIFGLSAYLLDKVQPCGLEAAIASFTFAAVPDALQTLIFTTPAGTKTIEFCNGVAGPDQIQRDGGASVNSLAAALRAFFSDAGNQGSYDTNLGFHFTAPVPGAAVVVATCSVAGAAGSKCAITGTAVAASKITLTSHGTATDRFRRTMETWTVSGLAAAVAALQARVDGGLACALSDINTALSTGTGVASSTNLTGVGVSDSFGTVAELLSILSGRGYRLIDGAVPYTGTQVSATGVYYPLFHAAAAGSFVETLGNAPTQLPVKPIRVSVQNAAFNMSISEGVLSKLAAGPAWNLNGGSYQVGNGGSSGIALTKAGTPISTYPYHGARANLWGGTTSANPGINATSSLAGVRLVTVYDDSGNVMV